MIADFDLRSVQLPWRQAWLTELIGRLRILSVSLFFALAALSACRSSTLSTGVRDAAREGVGGAGTGGQTIAVALGTGGSVPSFGTGGAGGATLISGAGGGAPDGADDGLDACSFAALFDALTPKVIGYCTIRAICDGDVGAPDSGVGICSSFGTTGTIELVDGCLIEAYGSRSCLPRFVFDDEGRLVSSAYGDISSWADYRWPYYAGKSIYYECFSE